MAGKIMSSRKTKSGVLLQLRGLTIAISITAVVGILNALWLGWHLFRLYEAISKSEDQGGTVQLNTTFTNRLIRIALALIISAICLYVRKLVFLCASLLALVWIGLEYFGWYIYSLQTLERAGLTTFPYGTSHAFKLYGASGWNVAVLVTTVILFLWEINLLIRILITQRSERDMQY